MTTSVVPSSRRTVPNSSTSTSPSLCAMPPAGSSSRSTAGSSASSEVSSTMRRVPVDSCPTGRCASGPRPMTSSSSMAWARLRRSAPLRPTEASTALDGSSDSCATVTVSSTVRVGKSRAAWNERTRPCSARCSGERWVMSLPWKSTAPASGLVKPATISKTVVLPAPLGPMIPRISPSCTCRSTPRTACTPPKDLVSPRVSSTTAPVRGRMVAPVTRGSAARSPTLTERSAAPPPASSSRACTGSMPEARARVSATRRRTAATPLPRPPGTITRMTSHDSVSTEMSSASNFSSVGMPTA